MMFKKIPLLFLPLLMLSLAGCMTEDEKLAAFFSGETLWNGRNTPGQLMTDRIADPETSILVGNLLSQDAAKKKKARLELQQLKELIEFGQEWDLPPFQLLLPLALKTPVIDGKIGFEEWKEKIETSGSCRAGRRRRNFDGSRMLLTFDKNMLYIAVYVPLTSSGKKVQVTQDDHLVLYFDMPGGSGSRYKECIIVPASGKRAAGINWVYCGNGKREQIAKDPAEPEIKTAAAVTKYGYSVEIAIPRSLLKIHPNGCARINLLRWDTLINDYRTPIAIPYHGHDPFNRINIRFGN